jgi:type I restriction enzyme M protein
MTKQEVEQKQINQPYGRHATRSEESSIRAIYKDYVLTLLFLKYISDVWRDHYEEYEKQYGYKPTLIEEMMKSERFVLPRDASFYALYERRFETGNGSVSTRPFMRFEEANIHKLQDVFQDISFQQHATR